MHCTRQHFENASPKIDTTQFCFGTIVVHYIGTQTYIFCGIDKLFVPDEGMMVRLSCRIIHENMPDFYQNFSLSEEFDKNDNCHETH